MFQRLEVMKLAMRKRPIRYLCVCVCARAWMDACVCVHACVRECVDACVCVRVRAWMDACVCVLACVSPIRSPSIHYICLSVLLLATVTHCVH